MGLDRMMRKSGKNRYRAAIVGLGDIAWKFDKRVKKSYPLTHAGAYMKDPSTALIGGCSPDRSDREAFGRQFGVQTFSDFKEMIDQAKPDIVSICSPSELHFEQALYCINKRVPMIWLEKPPAIDLKSMDKLISKLEKFGSSKVLVNYQRRYCLPYIKMKESISKKRMARAVHADLCYSRGLLPNGSHIIDASFFVFGEKDASLIFVDRDGDKMNPSFLLRFAGGVTCFVSGLNLPYHCIDISVTCESGRLSILHGGMRTRCEVKAGHELFPGFYRLTDCTANILGDGGFRDGMRSALRDLIGSHRRNREPVSNLYTARKTLAVIEEVMGRMKGCR